MDVNNVCVLIVEPDEATAQALTYWVDHRPGLSCCGTIGSVLMLPHALEKAHPDIVLLDLEHVGGCVLGTVWDLTQEGRPPCVVVLGNHPRPAEIYEAVDAGACGYAVKDDDPTELARVIAAAAKGEVSLSREAMAALKTPE